METDYETIKNYTGSDTILANAFRDLEIMIGDVDAEGHDTDAAVRALNALIDRANGPKDRDRCTMTKAELIEHVEELVAKLAMARTLILSAPLHMPTWPGGEARNSWVRDAEKWLSDIDGPSTSD